MDLLWIENKFGVDLYQRGISPEQQFWKIQRLKELGCVRIKTIDGIWYEVEGKRRLYNPITNVWRSKVGEKL